MYYVSRFQLFLPTTSLRSQTIVLLLIWRPRWIFSLFFTILQDEILNFFHYELFSFQLDNVSGGVTEWKGLLRDYWTRFSAYCKRVENVQIQQVLSSKNELLKSTFCNFVYKILTFLYICRWKKC